MSSLAAGCFTGSSNPRNRRSASAYSRPFQVCQIARHMPPLPTSNEVGLACYERSQPTTTDATDAVSDQACPSVPTVSLWGSKASPCPPPPSALSAVSSPEGLVLKIGQTTKVRPESKTSDPSRTSGALELLDQEDDQANYVHDEAQHRPGRLRPLGSFSQSGPLSCMRKEPYAQQDSSLGTIWT